MVLNPNQASYPKAVTVRASVADMRVRRGPLVPYYNLPLDRGRVFRFVADSPLVDDGTSVIDTSGAGQAGQWLLVREPIQGADLIDSAAQDVGVAGDFWRVIPAIPLTQHVVLTLITTNAEEGDIIQLTRLDVAAYTVAIVNGGPAAGTLATFPVSVEAEGAFYFDGTNWLKMRAALML